MSTEQERQDHEAQYNGWKNYPTWAVNLWLSNDEELYNETRLRTRRALIHADTDDLVERKVFTHDESARGELSRTLKDWVTYELAPDLGATFAADLLGYALGEVDWYEIAEAWLAES